MPTAGTRRTKTSQARDARPTRQPDPYGPFDPTGFDRETVLKWYQLVHLGRRLDERAQYYLRIGKGWSYHAPFAGHDGIQLAIGVTFRPGKDFLFPYYRDLLTCLAAGITPEEIILNGLSKDTDVASGGRHMSNHFAKPALRIQNVSSTTGNHAQHAVGVARAIRKYGGDEIAIYSGGDSACSEGFFYEAVNGASRERLPVIFVIQNNRYGISVPVTEQTANPDVADNFVGFRHLKIIKCDGRNPFDSYRAMQEARAYVLSGAGPAMVHADCDRIGSHSNSDDHRLYRSPEELEEVKRRDPLPRFRQTLLVYGIATEEEIRALEAENERIIREAAARAEAAPDPDPNSWSLYLLPEPFADKEDRSEEGYQSDPTQPQLTLREAINVTLKEEFRRNPHTFLWGQDVASKEKGGVFNVTKGMVQEFGNERVFNAPIAENFILGTANGFCRYREDIWVVVEGAEFADYFWPAMDQLVECSHEYWRTKGQYVPNIVIRIPSGDYIQGGLYHSQSIEGALVTLPGIRIVYPAFADDAIGLLRNALRSRGVTVFLESKFLYNYRPAAASKPPDEFIIPFGRAKVRRQGNDVTVVAYGVAVHWALQAAEEVAQEGISVEVVDLRSLAPWDKQTVLESVRKTNRLIVAHEDKRTGGFGGEVAAVIAEEGFSFLDAPIVRLGSRDCPIGFAKPLEQAIMLQPAEITEAIRRLVRY